MTRPAPYRLDCVYCICVFDLNLEGEGCQVRTEQTVVQSGWGCLCGCVLNRKLFPHCSGIVKARLSVSSTLEMLPLTLWWVLFPEGEHHSDPGDVSRTLSDICCHGNKSLFILLQSPAVILGATCHEHPPVQSVSMCLLLLSPLFKSYKVCSFIHFPLQSLCHVHYGPHTCGNQGHREETELRAGTSMLT